MSAVGWIARIQLRRHRAGLAAVALVVALGATATMTAIGASTRTDRAYGDYRSRAHVGDLIINPSLATDEIDGVIRSLPGATSVTSDGLLLAWLGDGTEELADTTQVHGSADGRFLEMDRPAVSDGRLPTGERELLVGEDVARRRHLHVGDVVTMSFGDPKYEFTLGPDAMPPVIGTEDLTLVGIGTFPDEVLPEPLFPQSVMIVSPDVAERYDCRAGIPSEGDGFDAALVTLMPPDCAMQYRYYSLSFRRGAAGVAPALASFAATAGRLNARLPDLTKIPGYPLETNLGYFQITTDTHLDAARVERSARPAVVAIAVLGLAAGVVTVIVAGLLLTRVIRRSDADQGPWRAMGLSPADRTRAVAVPLLVATVLGVTAGAVGAWLLSPLAPVGNVRSVLPDPSRELSVAVALTGVALLAALAGATLVAAHRSSRRTATTSARPEHRRGLRPRLVRPAPPEVADGFRAAVGRGSAAVVAIGAITAALSLGALVFGSSLSTLVSTPSSYGWTWDAAGLWNFGYGGIDLRAAAGVLDEHPDIERWDAYAFIVPISLGGSPTPGLATLDRTTASRAVVIDGRPPRAANEIALGSRTAAEEHLGIGDRVQVASDFFAPRRATVTGLVTLPALGPFESDRTGPGRGVLVPEAMIDTDSLDGYATFIGLDLAPGADPSAATRELGEDFAAWSTNGFPPTSFDAPVQPAEIVDARSMRVLPNVVGGLLLAAAVIGLSMSLALSVRGRRRQFGVLRALGFTPGQVRRSVVIQGLVTIAAAMVVAVPLGLLAGRFVWRAFATQLGVDPTPSVEVVAVVVAMAAPVLVAVLVSLVPARRAAQARPAEVLRAE